jgi:hypothetical protein
MGKALTTDRYFKGTLFTELFLALALSFAHKWKTVRAVIGLAVLESSLVRQDKTKQRMEDRVMDFSVY